jgi:uncharacterized cupin superfamily protein
MKGKPKEEPRKKLLLKAGEIERMRELPLSHPLNPKSGMLLRPLADTVGLSRLGVHLVRLKQGRESNMVHAHHYEEEFFYILSGRGVALIDGKKHAVGPGDFMAFPTPSVSHLLANPYEEDLLYLVGGERKAFEIGEFPTIGKWLIRDGHKAYLVDRDALEEIDWRKGIKKKD